ncbi:hypothetical protein BX661DRAFT_195477 [Kickxella alabastrina]|uniref:uncharacterized protein n=1 Tax=Kickxella alabastrina TaxID=61397 RepID=UPI00221F2AA2|nr:uncharacterized protein BX661DRAFT_195477 [Kickxella alabastrina]KAI7834911.1 hypothetical protein BX661DRAFT_195477 [Kickxella alabastrina]
MTDPPAHGILASLACVATNAFPKLATELHTLVSRSQADQVAAPGILEVLANHGGERFGEKDSTNELLVFQKWLDHVYNMSKDICDRPVAASGLEVPSFCGMLETVLGLRKLDVWPAVQLTLGDGDVRRIPVDLGRALARKWSTSGGATGAPPSMLFVRSGSSGDAQSLYALSTTSVLEFDTVSGTESCGKPKGARMEDAQREYESTQSILANIGISGKNTKTCGDDLLSALQVTRQWLDAPVSSALLEGSSANSSAVKNLLAMDIWPTLIERIRGMEVKTRRNLEILRRVPKYVLRAFIVQEDAPLGTQLGTADAARCKFTVVRRFGKAQDPGHCSALGSDGICWPIRIMDIRGTVVESMWVCCDDDDECKAGLGSATMLDGNGENNYGGINTVVADPDDDIYCYKCMELTSWGYNQIVICDGCERGVHQMCHVPVVTEEEVTRDQWFCSSCKKTRHSANTQ